MIWDKKNYKIWIHMKLNIRISFQYLLELVSFFFFFLWNNDFFIWNIHSLQIFIAQRWNMVLVRKNWHESGRHKVPISDVISRLTFKTENFVNMSHEVCMVRAIERQRRRPRSTFHHIDAATRNWSKFSRYDGIWN